jgi:hypothetical protein
MRTAVAGKSEELETLIHEEFDSSEHEVLCVCLGKPVFFIDKMLSLLIFLSWSTGIRNFPSPQRLRQFRPTSFGDLMFKKWRE